MFNKLNIKAPVPVAGVDKKALIEDVRMALYASKVTSYAQGMSIIKHKSEEMKWNVNLGGLARIWKVGVGGCKGGGAHASGRCVRRVGVCVGGARPHVEGMCVGGGGLARIWKGFVGCVWGGGARVWRAGGQAGRWGGKCRAGRAGCKQRG